MGFIRLAYKSLFIMFDWVNKQSFQGKIQTRATYTLNFVRVSPYYNSCRFVDYAWAKFAIVFIILTEILYFLVN